MQICVPIQAKTQNEAIKRLKEAKRGKADLAELWLDQITDLDLAPLLGAKNLPVVCVCKRVAEKGKFRGSFEALADVLLEAIKCGADYVDVPLQMPEKLNKKIVRQARAKKCRVITSYHNFTGTPDLSKLEKLAEKLQKRGAHVIKMATYANDMSDTVNMICLASYASSNKTPHILIAMGSKGILSRILTPTLGGEMMFATLKKGRETAPGQLTVKELRWAWSLLKT